ncbi:MAG: twin-arginine translocase subunit TatC [Planctomycetota bacterium]|nr:twin-arginine translocase subunit TatC [Planctomycetota bacterium]
MAEVKPKQPDKPDEVEASRMTLGEHLDELRSRLIRSVLAIGISFAVCWTFVKTLDGWVQQPYQTAVRDLNAELVIRAEKAINEDGALEDEWKEWYDEAGYPKTKVLRDDLAVPARMKGDAAAMGFFYQLKLCFYFSLFFGGPILLWQMWAFVAAGLYKHEKFVVHRYFPVSIGLFFSGVLFGYFVLIPNALYFLALQTLESIQWYESVDNYWTFLVALTLALGVIFQLPIVMLALARLGLVNPKDFGKYRPHMIVGSLVLGALITPPDPFTQMMMAGPIVVLYEIGHIASRLTVKQPVQRTSAP